MHLERSGFSLRFTMEPKVREKLPQPGVSDRATGMKSPSYIDTSAEEYVVSIFIFRRLPRTIPGSVVSCLYCHHIDPAPASRLTAYSVVHCNLSVDKVCTAKL